VRPIRGGSVRFARCARRIRIDVENAAKAERFLMPAPVKVEPLYEQIAVL
jgi:hypothetical protein